MRRYRSFAPGVAAAASLVAGYADLSAGGLTLGPILLVLGYCVAVPAALLSGGRIGRG